MIESLFSLVAGSTVPLNLSRHLPRYIQAILLATCICWIFSDFTLAGLMLCTSIDIDSVIAQCIGWLVAGILLFGFYFTYVMFGLYTRRCTKNYSRKLVGISVSVYSHLLASVVVVYQNSKCCKCYRNGVQKVSLCTSKYITGEEFVSVLQEFLCQLMSFLARVDVSNAFFIPIAWNVIAHSAT